MSSFGMDLGDAILAQLEEHQNVTKKKPQGSTKSSKQADHAQRDINKIGLEKDQSNNKKTTESSSSKKKKNRRSKTTAVHPASHAQQPASSVTGSQNNPTASKSKSKSPEARNEQKEIEKSDTGIADDREILLREIKMLGGTEEDLELISFSASEEEEIHEHSQVDPELIHDLKDFMKGLDFSAVIPKTIQQDQDSPQSNATGPKKVDPEEKSTKIVKKRKGTTTPSESCSGSKKKHQKRERKSKKPES